MGGGIEDMHKFRIYEIHGKAYSCPSNHLPSHGFRESLPVGCLRSYPGSPCTSKCSRVTAWLVNFGMRQSKRTFLARLWVQMKHRDPRRISHPQRQGTGAAGLYCTFKVKWLVAHG